MNNNININKITFSWYGGLTEIDDVSSFLLDIYPNGNPNILSFSIRLGKDNGIDLAKHFTSYSNNGGILPNNTIVDSFCEKIREIDFEKLKPSNHFLTPQEEDMNGVYKISYTIGEETIEVRNPNNTEIIRFCLNFIIGYILKNTEFRNLLLKYNENKNLNALGSLINSDFNFKINDEYKLNEFVSDEQIKIETKHNIPNTDIKIEDVINEIDKKLEELDKEEI